jgi:NADH-quinone oxidoreductase subunit L
LWRFRKVPLVAVRDDTHVETGFWKVLQQKYYVDEIYNAVVVRPAWAIANSVLYKGIDRGLIDSVTVNGVGWHLPWFIGKVGSALQNGRLSVYAWMLVLGAILVLAAVIV